jgi:hypothetical protein
MLLLAGEEECGIKIIAYMCCDSFNANLLYSSPYYRDSTAGFEPSTLLCWIQTLYLSIENSTVGFDEPSNLFYLDRNSFFIR